MKQKNSGSIRIFMTAFAGGILTLGLEIVAGRILSPFFGSSLHQWAALIGIVLLAYVIGYETYTRINRWGPTLPFALGGLYILTLPLWLFALLDHLLTFPLSIASIGGALLATGLPSVLWASVLPFLQKHKGNEKTASRVLAWSTAGNLVGVWGVAFVGIPEIGTRLTLITLGFLSLALSLFWASTMKPTSRATFVLFVLLMGGVIGGTSFYNSENNEQSWAAKYLHREDGYTTWLRIRDSAYQQIMIWSGNVANKARTVLTLNGNVQFVWAKDEKLTEAGMRYEYYNYATAAAYWTGNGAAKSILLLGVAGGLVPWQIRQFLPNVDITGFELDSTLAGMSKKSLPLSEVIPIDLQIGDARFLLRQTQKKFDYILVDCFLSSFIPFHLTTKEFFELIKAHLNPGGIVAANFHTIFESSRLLSSLENTMASTFNTVVSLDLPSGITLALGSAEPTSFEERFRTAGVLSPLALSLYSSEAVTMIRQTLPPLSSDPSILTDDRNNTEQLLFNTRKLVPVKRIL